MELLITEESSRMIRSTPLKEQEKGGECVKIKESTDNYF